MARNTYDKDEDLEETYNFGQLKRLGKYVKPHIKTMIFIILLMLSTAALGMLYPYKTGNGRLCSCKGFSLNSDSWSFYPCNIHLYCSCP